LFRDEGRPVEAVAHLSAAANLDPENAAYWEELAELHWEMEAAPEAIACWKRALAIWDRTQSQAPGRAVARNSLGWALQEEGRLAEAAECYQAALRLNPKLAPAHLNTGVLHEEKGELAEAEAAYRKAIQLQPAYPLAHSRLATLLRGKLPASDLAAMEACLASPRLEDAPRSRLLFAIAHVADAKGDTARAANCLRQANALNLEANRRRMRLYDPIEHDQFVSGLIAGFNREWFARIAGAGSPSRRPIFVIGLPRSGTTLVEQILASHPAVYGAGELTLARRGFESLPAVLGQPGASLRCLPALTAATIRRFAEEHLAHLQHLAPTTAERVVDKMPENYLYLGWIATLFPNATIIHCQRDLRDIALSCWMTDFRTLRWTSAAASIASRFHAYRRVMQHWERACPLPIHTVRYEDTVADLEAVARRLVAGCGLDWHPACLEFHQTKRTVRTASVTQVRQPLYSTSVARWKRYEHELADLFALLPPEEVKGENAP
jgi:Tfp pilus assembly protein PilF